MNEDEEYGLRLAGEPGFSQEIPSEERYDSDLGIDLTGQYSLD